MKKHASRTLTSVPFFRPQRKQTRNDDDMIVASTLSFLFEEARRGVVSPRWSPGMRVGRTDWTGC